MQDPHALCQVEAGQIVDVGRISTLTGDISDADTVPDEDTSNSEFEFQFDTAGNGSSPSRARSPRGTAPATQGALERIRARVAKAEAESGLPALSLAPEQAAMIRTIVRYTNGHQHLARLGAGERLTAHLYVTHANSQGYATPGLSRVGALLGVDAETAGDYLRRVSGLGYLRTTGRTRRDDGSLSVYRVGVRSITDATADGTRRRMTAAQCAVLIRWTAALLSDRDVTDLGPDDRWRLLLAAAEYTEGVFFGTQAVLAGLWGLSAGGTRKAVARMRKAGVLTTEQLREGSGRVGLSRWCIVPIVAAVATAKAGFAALEDLEAPLPDDLFAGLDRRPLLPNGPFKINFGSDLHKHRIAAGQDRRPLLPEQDAPLTTLDGELSVQKVREVGRTDGSESPAAKSKPALRTQPMRITEGTRLLGSICARLALGDPRWSQVRGIVLEDQGVVVDGLLAIGWTPQHIDALLDGQPLPHPAEVTTSIGAVVAGRLRTAAAGPVPQPRRAGLVDEPDSNAHRLAERHAWWLDEVGPRHSSTEAANRTVNQAKNHTVHPECEGKNGTCGRPTVPGELCQYCDPRPTPSERAAAEAFARWAEDDAKWRGLDAPTNAPRRDWLDGWELDSTPSGRAWSDAEATEAEHLIGLRD
ncbi:hypothetical protein ACIF6L_34935 [Kitasatospora sp. NPDC086009]|uniref:hypothetical protein n=1 Tax=unclassified Kitasatospora TaxID=2633591 RepID=UPI0037C6F334